MSALAFAVLALALTGPVPALLARASWPLRAPRAAVVLWQAVALAAVLSAFSAGLSVVALLLKRGVSALGWPLWLAQILMVPGFVLLALAGFYMLALHLRASTLTGATA